ncbi:MAG: DUF4878 domain-containing protein [Spirochaetales bacterium]|nr:DUF4878 domain-containing protein [Spirochaetales bacterium]
MKYSVLTVAVLVLALAACSAAGPEGVALDFLNRLVAYDFDGAAKLATDEGAAALKMMAGFMELDAAKESMEEQKAELAGVKPRIVSSRVDGDTAVVTYTGGDSDGEQTLDLVRINSAWKVDFKKTM